MAAVSSRTQRTVREFLREHSLEPKVDDLPTDAEIAAAVAKSKDLELVEDAELRELADSLALDLIALEPIAPDLNEVRFTLAKGGVQC